MSPENANPRAELEERLRFETLIADLSSKFVNLPAGEVDREIEDALRRVCEPLGIDLAVLWQWSGAAPGVAVPTHAYCTQEDLRPTEPMRQDQYPWAVQQVLAGRMFALSSLEQYPAEAAVDRETCRRFGIKAGVCLPLLVGGEPPIGALGLNALRAERNWPDALVQRLQLVAQIFANALARKRADHTLRESEELNRVTFEQAAVGIAHVGTDGRWLRVNDKLCAIVGYPRDELMDLTFQDITHPEDLDTDLNFVRQILSGDIRTYSMEKRYIRKDHSIVWVILTVSLVRTATGAPLHFISVVEDITERKRAEESLRDLPRRLIQAHEEERARLARDLHDDVTQRLARLAIDVGQVERAPDQTSQAETLRTVRDGLVSLSEDIHSLSYRLHPSVLEDLGLAEALKAECERFSRQESPVIVVNLGELPASVPPVMALCLFRVAQEALRNAARHAQARRVEVSARALDGGLQLAVLDDGIGFDAALQRDRPSLGLASMRERVHLLDGELDIESAPGHGTTILAWVPLKGEP